MTQLAVIDVNVNIGLINLKQNIHTIVHMEEERENLLTMLL